MPLIHTEAIVIRRRRSRDADAMITLFCKKCGKMVVSTKSVTKTKSRLAGVTQSFNHLHTVLYAKHEDQDIWTLTQTALIHSFENIQTEIHRMAFASCIAEWIEKLTNDHEKNMAIWNLLFSTLKRWEEQEPTVEDLFFYQWHLLGDAGLTPDLNQCTKCKRTDSPTWRYQAKDGVIYCGPCSKEGILLHMGSVLSLRKFSNYTAPPTLRLSPEQKKEINLLFKYHLEYHVGVQSRAALFLEQLISSPRNSTISGKKEESPS